MAKWATGEPPKKEGKYIVTLVTMKIVQHFRLWNDWRKKSLNSRLYKFLVLIGLAYSPTFRKAKVFYEISQSLKEGVENGST